MERRTKTSRPARSSAKVD
ncbi:hypothetical protein ACHAW6_012287 [Cyclotella cf. meneghiniana]